MEKEKEDFLIKIGKRVAEIRKGKGITIRQLAEISGISNPDISDIENGKHSVGIDRLNKICKALDVKIKIEK